MKTKNTNVSRRFYFRFARFYAALTSGVLILILGSLRNHDGDAEDNVDSKINLCFIYESRDTPKLFALFITVKAIAKLNPERYDQFEIKIKKISRRGSRSPDHARFGHFTLLFCRGRQRNVPRIKTHVHSHCSSH